MKRKSIISILLVVAIGLFLMSGAMLFKASADGEEILIYDATSTGIKLGDATTNGISGEVYNDALSYGTSTDVPVFDSDSSNNIAWTELVVTDTAVVLTFDEVSAATYPTFTIKLCVGSWETSISGEKLLLFGTQTTLNESTAVKTEEFVQGNTVKSLTLNTADFAGADGKMSSLTLMRTRQAGQIFFDYISFDPTTEEATSLYYQGQDVITTKNGDITDNNITWVEFAAHPQYDIYGYVERPAKSADLNTTTFPEAETTAGTGSLQGIKLKNLVFPIKLAKKVKASDYAQLSIKFFFTDWLNLSNQKFYLYGSGTTVFTDANGDLTGYALALNVKGPSTKQEIKTKDLTALADASGYIDYIYIVYGGSADDNGCYNGTQLWLNEINLLIPDDMPNPIVSDTFTTKDISEILPTGSGKEFSLTSNGKQSGEEGFGAETTVASAITAQTDVITFNFTPTYESGAEYSIYFLFKATNGGNYASSGLLFWISESNILIGNGTKNAYTRVEKTDFPDGTFKNGTTTKVTLKMIPYYLEGKQEGYYLAVVVNDAEKPLVEQYVEESDTTLGEYTTIVMQDLGKDYKVNIASALNTPNSAENVMQVKVATSTGSTTYSKPRAVISMTYFNVVGEEVSDLVIEGDATYNKDSKTLTFNKNGTVKVYYTVTNAFGTFKSNELSLTYNDGTTDSGNNSEEKTNSGCNCSGSIIGGEILICAIGVAVVLLIKRRKNKNKV